MVWELSQPQLLGSRLNHSESPHLNLLHLYPQKWFRQNQSLHHPDQEVSTMVYRDAPSFLGQAETYEIPGDVFEPNQLFDVAARPPRQPELYSQYSKLPNNHMREVINHLTHIHLLNTIKSFFIVFSILCCKV